MKSTPSHVKELTGCASMTQRNLYGGSPYWGWIPTLDTPVLLFDIETNGLLKQTTTIHCICAKDFLTGKSFSFGPNQIEEGLRLLAAAPLLVAHNGLCFDVPALQKLRPALALPRLFDTLTASRLIWTDLTGDDFKLRRSLQKRGGDFPASLMGKHKLEAWGYRLGCFKGDYGKQESAWDHWTPEMQTYCEQDVEVLEKLYRHILKQGYSPEALGLEHAFQQVIHRQEQVGVPFNVPDANVLYAELAGKREALKQQLDEVFPPKRVEEVFIPKVNNRTRGYVKGVPFTKVRYETFNPNSRQQIATRLKDLHDWQPSDFTETGEPKVDGDTLASLPYPEARPLSVYLELTKIIGMLSEGKAGWLRLVTQECRIHGSVITNGAVTGRCTHNSPNLAQIPRRGDLGLQCRALFCAPLDKPDWRMIGADASGLELRMLSHYLARYDGGTYGSEVVDGDIHTHNQHAAGLETRDDAKTFIYAYLYGAGDTKLGSIVSPVASAATQTRKGQMLRAKFLRAIPALRRLTEDVQSVLTGKDNRSFLYGLDGRKLNVRSSHSALNTLLQSAGAVLMKTATVIFHWESAKLGWKEGVDYVQVLHVHDEAQFLTHKDRAEELGKLFVRSIELAGEHFGMRCPTTGEYKVGKNWADTH